MEGSTLWRSVLAPESAHWCVARRLLVRARAFVKRANLQQRESGGRAFSESQLLDSQTRLIFVVLVAPIADSRRLRFFLNSGKAIDLEATTVAELVGDLEVTSVSVIVREYPQPANPTVRVAIVCQLKDASFRLESFIRYHFQLGFDRLYLYFDDCREVEDIDRAKLLGHEYGGRIVVTVRNRELAELWSALDGWDRLCDFANSDVQVRQMLNALHALEHARQDGMDWLLHIDSDELFYPGPHDTSVVPHFTALDASPCSIFTYFNFEAVPEALPRAPNSDSFRDVTLFKRPLALIPNLSSDGTKRALDFWKHRTPNHGLFLFYQNGKSAVRCSCDAVPASVHLWTPRLSAPASEIHRTNDPRNSGVTYDVSVECGILHFACTDPAMLWRKYATLGAFSNQCVANTVTHEPDTFHCLCRDVYLKHRADQDGGRAAMRNLFQSRIMLDDENAVACQMAAGVLVRISLAQVLLNDPVRIPTVATAHR